MAWETRPRGGRYYTRSRRVGGRVVREYIGTVVGGALAAQQDAAARAARLAQTDAAGAARARDEALERDVNAINEVADALMRAALLLAGYHRHHRGEWRRRRGHRRAGDQGAD